MVASLLHPPPTCPTMSSEHSCGRPRASSASWTFILLRKTRQFPQAPIPPLFVAVRSLSSHIATSLSARNLAGGCYNNFLESVPQTRQIWLVTSMLTTVSKPTCLSPFHGGRSCDSSRCATDRRAFLSGSYSSTCS